MFSFSNSDDHNIWDEHDWESHINEMTRRHEHLRDLIETDHDRQPRWLHHLKELPTKLDAVDAFIEEELLIEESHFPVEDEFDDDDDQLDFLEDDDADLSDDDEAGNLFGDEDDEFDDDIDDVEELFEDIFDEEASETSMYDYASLENIAIYTDARDFSADLLLFNDSKPHYMEHPEFIRFVSDILLVSSKVAAAYSMGFDLEVLGANIAYCKKALEKANLTLEHLQKIKNNPVDEQDYFMLHRRLFELRNNIAIHIQDTRHFFNSQI